MRRCAWAAATSRLTSPLSETRDPLANWDVHVPRNVDDWPPDCAQAFKEAVAQARRKFDIALPCGLPVAFSPIGATKTAS
jgi:hypothetical protein